MKYILKEINKEQLPDVLDQMWNLCQQTEAIILTDNNNAYSEFLTDMQNTFNYPDKIIVCYGNDKLVGVMKIVLEIADKYLESKRYYINSNYNYNEISKQFMEYIRKNYSGFEIDFVFFANNQRAIDYFTNNGFEILENDTEFNLYRNKFNCKAISNSVKRVTENDVDRYISYFDRYSEGMYWNGTRIKENFDTWRLYTYEYENEIIACTCVKILPVRNEIRKVEIFATFVEKGFNIEEIEQELLSKSMNDVFNENIEMAYLFIDHDDENEKSIAKSLGFEEIKTYISFRAQF